MMRKKEPSDKRFDPSHSTKKTVTAANPHLQGVTRRSTVVRPTLTVIPPHPAKAEDASSSSGRGEGEAEEERHGGASAGSGCHKNPASKLDADDLATTPGFSGTTASGTPPACGEF